MSRSNQYKRYTADEALQIILSPGDDSELSGLGDDENEEIEYEVVPEQIEEVVIEQVQQFEEERFPSQVEIDFAGETSVDSLNNELPCSSNVADGSSATDGNLPLPLQRNIRKRKIDSDDKPSSTNDANDGPSTAA